MKISNLISRIIVAFIGIPIVLLITYEGGYFFFAFISIASSLSLFEFYQLARKKSIEPLIWLGLVFGFLINLVFLYERIQKEILSFLLSKNISIGFPSQFVLLLSVFALFVFLAFIIELFRNKGSALNNLAITILGVFYISLFMGMLIATRELFEWDVFYAYLSKNYNEIVLLSPNNSVMNFKHWGGIFIICVFATVWICDSAAYFAGMSIGKNKLFERVSPKKTWEGAIFGLLFAIITMIIAHHTVLQFLNLFHCMVIGLVVGTIGQIGDLAQSLLKRDAGVKDSSALIPGHGGVFDRFDSIIFVSPVIYLYIDLIVFYF